MPLTVTCETVIADPPVLLNISDFVLLLPTCTLPKLRLVGFAVMVSAEGVVPVSDTVNDGLDASLVTVSVPVGLPAVVGANTTLNDLVAPAARVKGNVRPFTLYPVPVAVACETVTVDPPVLVIVSDNVLLCPIVTLPKLSGEVVAVSVPAVVAVPESDTVNDGLDALLVTVNVPVGLPEVVGANTTLNDLLAPAARVKGTVTPLTLKPVPVAEACETVTVDPPVLVIVSDSVLLCPTVTPPKLRGVVVAVRAPTAAAIPDNETVNDGFDASLVTVNVSVGLPAVVGANTTLNDLFAPAAKVKGRVTPLTL